jgi:photosynthetic reaction center cytochrome c subunit
MKRVLTPCAALLAAAVLLAGCERPPVDSVQRGYRGTGMELIYNPRTLASLRAENVVPPMPEPASPEGPRAKQVFKNLQVLGELSVGELTRYMTAVTAWVSPTQGCNYCHVPENLADDSKYTKVVARRMMQMTNHINADWKSHVAETGVTCFTCHRGNNVPRQAWFKPVPQDLKSDFIGNRDGQSQASKTVGLTSLPYNPFTPYLLDAQTIGVGANTALPTGHVASIVHTEQTYGLMIHMAEGLGVNCTFCHNTHNFKDWKGVPPQRATAWYGIRMARELNNDYLVPLTSTFPPNRLGPTGDVAKVNCATCHQGVYKPLFGAPMAKAFPELQADAAMPGSVPATQRIAAAAGP